VNTRLAFLILLLLSCGACVVTIPQGHYQIVGQARLEFEGQTLDEAFARLRGLADGHGYRLHGTPAQKFERGGSVVELDGPNGSDSLALFILGADCISLEALLKEQSAGYRAPRALFDDVVRQLRADAKWRVRVDEICPKSSAAT